MVTIGLDQEAWEYGVRALLMSFFPHQNFQVDRRTMPVLTDAQKRERLQITQQKENETVTIAVTFFDTDGRAYTKTVSVVVDGQEEQEKDVKNALDHAMYAVLSAATKKELPWGILSGIRPTKLPMAMLEQGMSDERIRQRLMLRHLVSKRKADVSLEIAKREKALLETLDYEKGYSLYVGIPFCPSTCLYCSFPSYPLAMWQTRVEDYLDALEHEMAETAKLFRGRILQTIYVGGGTPTSLSAKQLDRLCCMLETYFDMQQVREFTIEAGRPDSITWEKLLVIQKHKADRISINPQTMKQETLDLIGRHHTVGQVEETYRMARQAGFDNINMDLILGLPMETAEDVAYTLQRMYELAPDNLTVHSLAIKRAARLNLNWEQYAHMRIENSDSMMEEAYRMAEKMGLFPYYLYRQKNMAGNFENVGFAKPGKEGLYNILIMEEKQTILALGAGASTKAVFPNGRIERCENVKDVAGYIARIEEMVERKRQLLK